MVVQAVGDGPVAAGVLAGDELGVNDAFLVPLVGNLQGFLVLVGGGGVFHLAVNQLEVGVVGAAVAGAGVHAIGAPQHAQAVGGQAVGVIHTVAVGVFLGEADHQVVELVQGGGDFSTQLFQPGLVVHHGQVEQVARSDGGNAILLAVHRAVGPVAAVLIGVDGGADVGGQAAQGVHVDFTQHALIHIAHELAGILQTDDVGHIVAHDVGVQHLVEVGVIDGKHIDVHIEGVLDLLDDDSIFRGRSSVIGGPGDGHLFTGAPVDFLGAGEGGEGNQGQQQAQGHCQSDDFPHGISSFFNILKRV